MLPVKVDVKLLKLLRNKTDLPYIDCKEALAQSNNNLDDALRILKIKGLAKAEKKSINKTTEGITRVLINGNDAVVAELNCQSEQVAILSEFSSLLNNILALILKNKPATMKDVLNLETANKDLVSNEIKMAIAKLGENIVLSRFQILTKTSNEVFGSYIHGGGKYAGLVVIAGVDEQSEVPNNMAMQAVVSATVKYIDIDQIPNNIKAQQLSILKAQVVSLNKPPQIIEKMLQGRMANFLSEITIVNQPYIKDPSITVKEYLVKNYATIKAMIRYQLGENVDNCN